MLSKWLERLRGGSGSSKSQQTEPATAPEPQTMPPDAPADTGLSEDGTSEPSGDEPS